MTSISSKQIMRQRGGSRAGGASMMKHPDGRARAAGGANGRNGTAIVRIVLGFVGIQLVLALLYVVFWVEEGGTAAGTALSSQVDRFGRHARIRADERATHERAVLEARYFLIDLRVPGNALSSIHNDNAHNDTIASYHGVVGTFCPLDWHLQKSNPSSVPMFRELVAKSLHCDANHKVELDLATIVKEARHYDEHSTTGTTTIRQLQLAGLVFHETRCGSTLTANLLSAAHPPAHRVYSEASPLLAAMSACQNGYSFSCVEEKHNALLRDVLYLMGRSSDVLEKRVFYKIQSIGVRHIATLTNPRVLLQDVPWMFLYRNSVEVIMSHFKEASIQSRAVCLRGRNSPKQHALVGDIAAAHDRTVGSLSKAEYCAVHLASLCEAAIRHYEQDDTSSVTTTATLSKGRFVNYADLPDILWDSVLPNHFGVPLNHIHVAEMIKAASVYSKGRGNKANVEWKEDSTHKQAKVSDEIRQAAEQFLQPSFDKLEELAHA